MMPEDILDRVAKEIRDEAMRFKSPVHFYVKDEALHRWQDENPDKDWITDNPDSDDLEMESWRILARAALRALKEEER